MDKLSILIKNKDLLDIDKFNLYLETLKLKEENTYNHSVRVSNYSTKLAQKIGLCSDDIAVVWISSLLHDLGKLMVPNYVLLGTSKLDNEELILIQKHPIDSLRFLKEFTSERVYKGAVEHHERLDGRGYPYGVSDISLIGRIIAITDTFDAMTSNRTYQDSVNYKDALNIMQNLAECNMYDLELFNSFKELIIEMYCL